MTDALPQPQAPAPASNAEELQAKFGEIYQQIAQSPNHPDLRVRLGYVALDLGGRKEAINAFVRAIQLDPSFQFIRARLRSIRTSRIPWTRLASASSGSSPALRRSFRPSSSPCSSCPR